MVSMVSAGLRATKTQNLLNDKSWKTTSGLNRKWVIEPEIRHYFRNPSTKFKLKMIPKLRWPWWRYFTEKKIFYLDPYFSFLLPKLLRRQPTHKSVRLKYLLITVDPPIFCIFMSSTISQKIEWKSLIEDLSSRILRRRTTDWYNMRSRKNWRQEAPKNQVFYILLDFIATV